ncbi:MAG: DUF423 domain-containing protein [Pseudomonadota bacterium]
MTSFRPTLAVAATLGFTGVALGAFGAHALADTIGAESLPTWKTAVQYQLIHAVALLGIAALEARSAAALLRWSGRLFVLGVVLFSGSLYVLVLDGPRWLGPVTPLGGLALLAGWLLLGIFGLRSER